MSSRQVKLDITYSDTGTECVLTKGSRSATVIFPSEPGGEVDFRVQEYPSPQDANAARPGAGE